MSAKMVANRIWTHDRTGATKTGGTSI